jgi:hypothetical protein
MYYCLFYLVISLLYLTGIVHNTEHLLIDKYKQAYKEAGLQFTGNRSYGGRFIYLTFLNMVTF